MKRKGFTLIETIICISLVVLIGVGSFVGIRFVSNNIKISRLEQITDKAIQAAQVYIETNKESYNQLYSNKNGVVLPLNLLVNEGLLSLDNTDLKKNEYENEYIVTMLQTPSDTNCIDISSQASWNLSKSKPFYICNNSTEYDDTEIRNKISDLETKINKINDRNNISYVQDTSYYFKGPNPDNYLSYNGTTYRIFKVDTDDSLYVVGPTTSSFKLRAGTTAVDFGNVGRHWWHWGDAIPEYITTFIDTLKKTIEGDAWLDVNWNRSCIGCQTYAVYYHNGEFKENILQYVDSYHSPDINKLSTYTYLTGGTLSILDSCYKISGGTGSNSNKFILDDSKCT